MTELPWRSISTSEQEQREFKSRSIEFSRFMQKDLSNHSINDPSSLKRKENANDCTTSTGQGLSKTTEPSLAFNKCDKEKKRSSKESKNSTTRLTLKQAGGSTKSRGETCQQVRHRRQKWDRTQWKTSSRNSQHFSKSDDL